LPLNTDTITPTAAVARKPVKHFADDLPRKLTRSVPLPSSIAKFDVDHHNALALDILLFGNFTCAELRLLATSPTFLPLMCADPTPPTTIKRSGVPAPFPSATSIWELIAYFARSVYFARPVPSTTELYTESHLYEMCPHVKRIAARPPFDLTSSRARTLRAFSGPMLTFLKSMAPSARALASSNSV